MLRYAKEQYRIYFASKSDLLPITDIALEVLPLAGIDWLPIKGVRDMEALGERPTNGELEQLAEVLLDEHSITGQPNPLGDELVIAIGAIYECISLRKGIERVIETCTDEKTVAYLEKLMENMDQHYVIIGNREAEE